MSQLKVKFPFEIKKEPDAEDSFENAALVEEQDWIKKDGDDVLAQSLCCPKFDNVEFEPFTILKFEATPFELSAQKLPVKNKFVDAENEFIAEERNVKDNDSTGENSLLEVMETPPSFAATSANQTSSSDGNDKTNKSTNADIDENPNLKCYLCTEPLEDFTSLKHHFRNKHNCDGYAVCCKKSFRTRGVYYDHLKWHKDPLYFKCTQCIKVFASRNNLYKHSLWAHSTVKDLQFPCTKCDRKFGKKFLADHHIKVAHKRKSDGNGRIDKANKSDTMNKAIVIKKRKGTEKQKNEIADQEYEIDANIVINAKLTCCLCSEPLDNFTNLKHHFRNKHNCAGYAVCCNKSFYVRGEYYDHLKWHKDPLYFKCTECKKVFGNRNSLYRHSLRAHSTEQDLHFSCTMCVRKFCKQYLLDQHLRVSHKRKSDGNYTNDKISEADNVNNGISIKKEKGTENQKNEEAVHECKPDAEIVKNAKLICCLCSEQLECFKMLKYHFRHKHFCAGYAVCCNKSFYVRCEYYDHLKLHEDPEYFKCTQCNKVMATRKTLDVHILKTHPSEQDLQFPCTKCNRKFCKQYLLDQHLRNPGKCRVQKRHKDENSEKVFKCKEGI